LWLRDIDVEAYVDQLREWVPYVPPVSVEKIKALHEKGDFGAVVKHIRSTMNVGVNLTLHWTCGPPPKGLEEAKAWIRLPENMPYYGTAAFKEMKLDIFVLKSTRDASTYDEFAITIAHELSHVVLESIQHPLRTEEKAVDLTAMILGFSYLYRTAAHTSCRVGYDQVQYKQNVYLTERETNAAAKILIPFRLRAKYRWRNYARENLARLVLLGFFAVLYFAFFISHEFGKYQIAAGSLTVLRAVFH
jgi:hypothetical protein